MGFPHTHHAPNPKIYAFVERLLTTKPNPQPTNETSPVLLKIFVKVPDEKLIFKHVEGAIS